MPCNEFNTFSWFVTSINTVHKDINYFRNKLSEFITCRCHIVTAIIVTTISCRNNDCCDNMSLSYCHSNHCYDRISSYLSKCQITPIANKLYVVLTRHSTFYLTQEKIENILIQTFTIQIQLFDPSIVYTHKWRYKRLNKYMN